MNDERIARRAALALLDEAARCADTDRAFTELVDEIDHPLIPTTPTAAHAPRRAWIAVASLVAVAAASLVAVAVVRDDHGEPSIVNDTTPTVAPETSLVPAPITSVPPTTDVVTDVPPAAGPTLIDMTIAGSTGVWSWGLGGATKLVNDEMQFAMRLPDGRVLVQRKTGFGDWPASETTPMVIDRSGPQTVINELVPGRDWGGWIRMHDVNLVDGHTVLLYEVEQAPEPTVYTHPVVAEDLDAGIRQTFADAGGAWEQDNSRLHLAANGWIVGERRLLGSSEPILLTIGDSLPPTTDELGLEPFSDIYTEGCVDECVRSFTVSHDGSLIGWLDGTDLITVNSDDLTEASRVPLGDAARDGYLELDIELGRALVGHMPSMAVHPLLVLAGASPSIVELTGATGTFAPVPRPTPRFAEPLVDPVIDVDGCTSTRTFEHDGPLGLFIHSNAGPHPVQLIADQRLGVAAPYAIVERFFTGQRFGLDDPFESNAFVNDRPARTFSAGDGQGEVNWLLADGTEVYVRARGFDRDQLLALAMGLTPRPADAPIPGFDFVAPPLSNLTLLDETAALTGSTVSASCGLADLGPVGGALLTGDPVFTYAVALDWAPVPQVIDLGDGRLLSVRAPGLELQRVIDSLHDRRDER